MMHRRHLSISSIAALAASLWLPAAHGAATTSDVKVREAAVAGLFYPGGRAELEQMLGRLLEEPGKTEAKGAAGTVAEKAQLRALICPHAGYVYSGPIAASGYRLLAGRSYDTVVVLAPSHYASIRGASVSDAAVYRTPLGDTPLSPLALKLASQKPFALQPECYVQRPAWWTQSRRPAPLPGKDTAETWEHSDEVQIPFIQKVLPKAALIPAICGDLDPTQAAEALGRFVDDKTLIVVSSDLSHYKSYAAAREQDLRTVAAICRLDGKAIGDEDACGRIPIKIVIELAKKYGWRAQLLDYRNSGDTAGDKARVVGYAAIAFYGETPKDAGSATVSEKPLQPKEPQVSSKQLTSTHRQMLLEWARLSLSEATLTGGTIAVKLDAVPEPLRAKRGCFVTLTQRGQLRGCIGHIFPQEPLYKAVISNARSAALRDPRFRPVTSAEAKGLRVEVSVLTEPQQLVFSSPEDLLSKLQPKRDGVVFIYGQRSSTYLPQVWDQIPDKVDFMNSLAEKAGLPASAWRQPGVQILTYQVEAFHESEAL